MERLNSIIMRRFGYLSLYLFIITAMMAAIATGCGNNDGGLSATESEIGTLSLLLTDAVTDDYQAVYVTISNVRVHIAEEASEGEADETDESTADWEQVVSDSGTYNLLELVNGVMQQLGITELETGHYTQVRLYLGDEPDDTINILGNPHPFANYVIDFSENASELFIPSGYQSGIKLVKGFDIEAGVTKELVLDFDSQKSIIKPGVSGNILLKPTIKVMDVINRPVVTGTIYEEDGTTPVPGAYVSAQVYDPAATDAKDRVIVSAGTISDEYGNYSMILEPGTYNIVIYKDGMMPSYFKLEAEENGPYDDMTISLSTASATINISGGVDISGDGEGQSATISFRQIADYDEGDEEIEIISENVEDGGEYDVYLPEGIYDIVASSGDLATQVNEDISSDTIWDIVF
jgi:hypothetical protein